MRAIRNLNLVPEWVATGAQQGYLTPFIGFYLAIIGGLLALIGGALSS